MVRSGGFDGSRKVPRPTFKSKSCSGANEVKVSLVWSSPKPERTIATAMRRCYSTKPIEGIEAELEEKGPEYWRFLLSKALQDKSLDVLEHYTMTLLLEGVQGDDVCALIVAHPHLRASMLKVGSWLVSLNARTLVELWKDPKSRGFAELAISELNGKGIGLLFNELAFGANKGAS